MSRIGKNPINVPSEVKVNVAGSTVTLEGPKGKLDLVIPVGTNVDFADGQLKVTRESNSKQSRSNHGTIRSRLANMVIGVTKGHKRELEIQGIGFRAQMEGEKINFNLGFSHPVIFDIPNEVKISVDKKQTIITVEGPDNVMVGQVAANIKRLKPVEPYKGKGIRFVGEAVRRKQGKSVTK
jgi:large subunit ribosomal protein L6